MKKPLAGMSAVVTGATRGIGRAIAIRLHDDGAHVVGTGTKADGSAPEGIAYRACDFADMDAILGLAEELRALQPDILVNNAGVNKIGPFADYELKDLLRILQINVTAPFLLCQAVVPGMRKKGWGRIVNISSIWGNICREHRAAYAASKFGIDGMTAGLAAEVARDGILANCVSPGFIATEMAIGILGTAGMNALAEQVPAKRVGTPEEVAAFVAWLAGPENTYVSGQNILIDGGFSRV